MRRRRWVWLFSALVLLGAAAWLMSRKDVERPEPAWRRVEMPRRMTPTERQRAQQRRTLPAAPSPVDSPTPPKPSPPRDPVLAALPPRFEHGAVVIEANAVRHSPVGQLLVDCAVSRDGGRRLQEFRELTGIDPLEDVDRVAMADESLIVSGHFGDAQWARLFSGTGTPHGSRGTLYRGGIAEAGRREQLTFGVWGEQLIVFAPDEAQVRAALDRLEGNGEQSEQAFDDSLTYGEIYGVLSAAAFADALPPDQAQLAEKLRSAAERIELHVDTSRDVGIVADVKGPDGRDTEDLGKSMGAALALARLQAQAEGENELVELMDLARVVPDDGQFRVEMGVPLEVLEKHLRKCVERNEARRNRAAATPGEDTPL